MPWTIADVDKHKKGLTDAQKRRWVSIANSVRIKCLEEGKKEAYCDASAIRQANATVNNNNGRYGVFSINKNENYEIREEQHEGRKHIVVPVVMMVEGVHHGSHGALLHPADELGRFPEAWNGIPVVINHPEREGMNVSANSPSVLEEEKVGRVFNAYMENDKLKAEVWIDVEKLSEKSPATLELIQLGDPLDVSVGVFTEEEEQQGTWNNEQYTAIARNHRPDHLALLPGGTGACSWNDGCGIRTNQKGGNKLKKEESDFKTMKQECVEQVIQSNADMGYRELVESAARKIDGLDNDSYYHFLHEVFEDHVVYEARSKNSNSSKLYKQDYQINEDGILDFSGDPVEVVKKVEYNVVRTHRTKFNNNSKKEDKSMAEEKKPCGQCMEKVVALINHKQTKFTSADREWLLTQEEAVLDKLFPEEVAPEEKQEVQALSAEDQAALAYGKKQLNARRVELIAKIQGNAKDTWSNEELQAMGVDMLEKIAGMVKDVEVTDYSAAAAGVRTNGAEVIQPMAPTGVEFK